MKKVTIIFDQMPHGNALGREALDAALALSDINQISVVFINEGVFHLLPNQLPDAILARDYIATLKMLEVYDIEQVYTSQHSLEQYNLTTLPSIIAVERLNDDALSSFLRQQDCILRF